MQGTGNRVQNDIIHDTDYAGDDSAAIYVNGTGNLIDHNTIYNSGRSGILFSHSLQTQVTYNNISAVMLELGLPYIKGYKPLSNIQEALLTEVRRRLESDPNWFAELRPQRQSERVPGPLTSPQGRCPEQRQHCPGPPQR